VTTLSARRVLRVATIVIVTASSCLLGSAAVGATTLKAPVITERFTPLPCHMNTTIGMEGCAEAKILRDDKRLNEQVAIIFGLLHGTNQKLDFINAETLWLKYRGADCQSFANVFAGGSFAPVAYANCDVQDDVWRSADLHSLFRGLTEGDGANVPTWP
jgi:uncharacterized protein YecT (DUF1311 family)